MLIIATVGLAIIAATILYDDVASKRVRLVVRAVGLACIIVGLALAEVPLKSLI